MVVTADVRTTGSTRRYIAVFALGAVLGGTAGVLAVWDRPSRGAVVEGWATPTADGMEIALASAPNAQDGRGYEIAGARWAGPDGQWHAADGPTCVGTDGNMATRVRLNVVNAEAANGTQEFVVVLQCFG